MLFFFLPDRMLSTNTESTCFQVAQFTLHHQSLPSVTMKINDADEPRSIRESPFCTHLSN